MMYHAPWQSGRESAPHHPRPVTYAQVRSARVSGSVGRGPWVRSAQAGTDPDGAVLAGPCRSVVGSAVRTAFCRGPTTDGPQRTLRAAGPRKRQWLQDVPAHGGRNRHVRVRSAPGSVGMSGRSGCAEQSHRTPPPGPVPLEGHPTEQGHRGRFPGFARRRSSGPLGHRPAARHPYRSSGFRRDTDLPTNLLLAPGFRPEHREQSSGNRILPDRPIPAQTLPPADTPAVRSDGRSGSSRRCSSCRPIRRSSPPPPSRPSGPCSSQDGLVTPAQLLAVQQYSWQHKLDLRQALLKLKLVPPDQLAKLVNERVPLILEAVDENLPVLAEDRPADLPQVAARGDGAATRPKADADLDPRRRRGSSRPGRRRRPTSPWPSGTSAASCARSPPPPGRSTSSPRSSAAPATAGPPTSTSTRRKTTPASATGSTASSTTSSTSSSARPRRSSAGSRSCRT